MAVEIRINRALHPTNYSLMTFMIVIYAPDLLFTPLLLYWFLVAFVRLRGVGLVLPRTRSLSANLRPDMLIFPL
jgi:hypothetical protein